MRHCEDLRRSPSPSSRFAGCPGSAPQHRHVQCLPAALDAGCRLTPAPSMLLRRAQSRSRSGARHRAKAGDLRLDIPRPLGSSMVWGLGGEGLGLGVQICPATGQCVSQPDSVPSPRGLSIKPPGENIRHLSYQKHQGECNAAGSRPHSGLVRSSLRRALRVQLQGEKSNLNYGAPGVLVRPLPWPQHTGRVLLSQRLGTEWGRKWPRAHPGNLCSPLPTSLWALRLGGHMSHSLQADFLVGLQQVFQKGAALRSQGWL